MATSFDCPSCGAALEPPTTPVTSVQCHFCGTTVSVPEELRVKPVAPAQSPQNITINLGTPQGGGVTFNLPPDEVARLEQLERAEAAMVTSRTARRTARGCSGCGCLFGLLFFAGFAAFMIYIFGFSIKSSVMYRCAVQMAESNPQVVKLIGTPIKADNCAWISNYESSGSNENGHFTTQLSGPKGSGTLSVDGSHSRSGTDLDVTCEVNGEAVQVHSGAAQCK